MNRILSHSARLLALAALAACATDDPSASSELSDTAALDAQGVEDDVFVPDGYTRADMVEILPGTWAPADQAERIRAIKLADLEGRERPSADELYGPAAPPSSCDTDYYCTMSGSGEESWLSPDCTGKNKDNCYASLSGSASYHEAFVPKPHCDDPCDSSCWKVQESTSSLTATLRAQTDLKYSNMVMLAVDGEATWGSLTAHPTGYTYPSSSKIVDLEKSKTATGTYADVDGDLSADYVADSSGYELEYIFNRVTASGGAKTARKDFDAISMTETCWSE